MNTNLGDAEKLQRHKELGRHRQESRWPGYNNIGDYHGAVYESEWVSPYTQSACNLSASLMILLQDWASDDRMKGPVHEHKRDFGYTPELDTNKNLFRLLETHFGLKLSDTFATNLLPFVKLGGMSARIPQRDLIRAAKEFAIPQIEIVQPKTLACLGLSTFKAMSFALGRRPVKTIEEGVSSPFMYQETQIWCQAHTGRLGSINRNSGGVNRVDKDWEAMSIAHMRRNTSRGPR